MTSPLKRHDYYLGPLGRLVAIRDPAAGYQPTPEITVAVHTLLSGKVRTDRPVFTPRVYSLSFNAMSDAEKAWLEQCSLGLIPGALYWVDPLVRNQLSPSVSAPTGDVSDLTATSGTVTYRPDGSQGFGGVDWVPTGASELHVVPRLPAVAGLALNASAWITRYSGAATDVSMNVDWYSIGGTILSRTVGAAVTLTTTGVAYRAVAATSAPPAGAVECRLALYATDGRSFRVDSWQAEYGSLSPSAFAAGPGLAKVAILGYEPDVYLSGITSVSMSMVEVGGGSGGGSGVDGGGSGGSGEGGDAVILYDAKGDILVGLSDDVPVRLPVGTNGQVLTVDTASSLGVKWATGSAGGGVPLTLVDAKGDLIVGSAADAAARLALGTNDQVLTVDTATILGVKWAPGSGGGGTVSSPLDLAQIATPTAPAAGRSKLYPKADGRYYSLGPTGLEQLVGSIARTLSQASIATLVPEPRDYESFDLTAQAVGLTIANHVDSVPENFERFQVRIFSAAAQTITYGTNYVSGGPPLPVTTKAGKELTLGFQWNARVAKFDLVASLEKL